MARFSWRKWLGLDSRRSNRKRPQATSRPRVEALEDRVVPSTLLDNVNGFRTPSGGSWLATDVGWNYTPSISYSLNEIGTNFAPNPGADSSTFNSVTLEIRDGGLGGSTLRTSSTASVNEYYGGSYGFYFSALTFTAGHTYFIGFRNVANLGLNVTTDSTATSLGSDYYDFDHSAHYSFQFSGGYTSQPILNFYEYGPPVYFLTVPPSNLIPPSNNSRSATFKWQATDEGNGVSGFQYQLDGGSSGFTGNPGNNTGSVSFSGLADGYHSFSVHAYDSAGYYGDVSTYSWYIDATAPVVSINSGPASLTNSANAGFYVTASDPVVNGYDSGVNHLVWWLDGTSPTTTGGAETGPFFAGLSDGVHTFHVYAVDNDGNVSATSTYSWTIDTTPPTTSAALSGTAGTNGWYTSPVTVSLSATDSGSGVATTYYRIGGSGSYSVYNAAQPPVIAADGSTSVYFYSVDAADNPEAPKSVTFEVDQTAPQVSMTGPATNSYTNNNQPTLTATASDATSGVANVQFQISSDGTTWTAVSGTVSQNGNSYSLPVPSALADGSYEVRAIATDAAGNTTTSAAASFTVDTVPPGITNVSDVPDPFSPNGDGVKDSTTISYTLSEASNVTVAISDANSTPIRTLLNGVPQAAGAQSVVWDGTNDNGAVVADGTYTYDITATDAAGNSTDSVTLANTDHTVTVDNTAPTASIIAAPIDPTNVNSAGFTFSGSDNFTDTANLVYQYSLDGVNYWTLPDNTLSLSGLADGRYTLSVQSIDQAGNVSSPVSYSWTVDTTAPTTTASVSGAQGTNGWYTGPATVTLSATDLTDKNGDEPVSGVAQTYYTVDGGAQQTYSAPFLLSDDGRHTIAFWSVDNAGNVETPQNTLAINIDQTAPTISGAPTTAANANGWYNGPVTVAFSASDDTSGLASYTQPVTLTGEGAGQSVTGTATDNAGNTASATVSGINIDETAPTTTASVSAQPNANGWNNTDVTVTLTAQDNLSGVATTYYTLDGVQQTYSGPFTISAEGQHTITYWSVDNADNAEAPGSLSVNIDKTAPTLTLPANITAEATGPAGAVVTYSDSADDGSGSGVASFTSAPASGSTFALGTTTVNVSATDLAGNTATGSFTVTVQDTTPPALTTVPNQVLEATSPAGAVATYSATATDIVDGSDPVVFTVPSGSTFALGTTLVTYSATDAHGNTATGSFSVTVQDTTPPTLSAVPNQTLEATGPAGAVATYTATATDIVDGTDPVIFSIPSGSTFALGTTTVHYSASDAAGNTSSGSFTVTVRDTIAPVTTAPPSSALTSTYPASVSVSLSATDSGSGVAATYYQVDGGAYSVYGGAFTVSGAGTHSVSFYSRDNVGNVETPHSVAVIISQATPSVGAIAPSETYTAQPYSLATATATGVGSDGTLASSTLDSATLSFSYYAGPVVTGSPLSGAPTNPGTYTVVAHYTSDNNNYNNADSSPATFTITPIGVTIGGDVYVLNQTASGALTISGNAQLNVAGTLQVDSNSASAVNLSGNSDVDAAQTLIVGGDQVSGNAHFKHTPRTHAAFVANPLGDLAAPTGGTSYAAVNLAGNSTLTIDPGVYPSITVSGNAKLILNPGTYVIGSGGITVSGNATVTTGQGVLIYNSGALTVSGNASLTVTALSTGVYAGLGIFQAATDASAVTVSGNANLNLNGSLLYQANAQSVLTISGNGTVEASLVVNELTISGNSDDSAQ